MSEEMKIARGLILKNLRNQQGKSQKEVAESLGTSQQVYQNYESGKREANYDMLINLADFYGVTIDYLLGRKAISPQLPEWCERTDEKHFTELFSALPEYAKQIFIDFMEKIAQAMEQENPQLKKQRYVERLGDIEDERQQDEQAKSGEETSCA